MDLHNIALQREQELLHDERIDLLGDKSTNANCIESADFSTTGFSYTLLLIAGKYKPTIRAAPRRRKREHV